MGAKKMGAKKIFGSVKDWSQICQIAIKHAGKNLKDMSKELDISSKTLAQYRDGTPLKYVRDGKPDNTLKNMAKYLNLEKSDLMYGVDYFATRLSLMSGKTKETLLSYCSKTTPEMTIFQGGMQHAKDKIIEVIKINKPKIFEKDLEVKIIGCRLREIRTVLDHLHGENLEKMLFKFYHLDPNAYEVLFNPEEAFGKIQEMKLLFQDIVKKPCDFFSYYHRPFIYAFFIPSVALFFGFFFWRPYYKDEKNEMIPNYDGPKNPCFYLQRHTAGFSEISKWLENFCDKCEGKTMVL